MGDMDRDRWQQIQEVFTAVRACEPAGTVWALLLALGVGDPEGDIEQHHGQGTQHQSGGDPGDR